MKIKEGGGMDIQEKKAFEIAFDNKLGARGCQFDLDEDGNYEDRETLCGWHMWLEAKAQAIPDGFVLVPKEPNREFKDRLRSYLDNLWMGDHGCDWDYFVDATAIKSNEIWRFMIEAQEPANESECTN
ncbi:MULTISPECIES: hypothetical protein [unclassified Acinetobacter]|uniref:hypothetical protein n=1 Tax=unclassified Acinetobacter TaxID=196816 RepID=UPI0015D40DCA|nr:MULTISPECIES: hypothetical protein [unclassified Acinetobacter]